MTAQTKSIVFQSGREQQGVSFEYTPTVAGASEVSIGEASGSFTALPADGSLLPLPKGLGDIKILRATGIHDTPLGGFVHIHGIAFDPMEHSLWAADAELGNNLLRVEAWACDGSRQTPLERIQVPTKSESLEIQDLAFDRQDRSIYYLERGVLRQIDIEGKLVRENNFAGRAIHLGEVVVNAQTFYTLVVQGDYVWVGTEALLIQFDKRTLVETGAVVGLSGTGAAYDPDRNVIWSSDWLDCRFEAFDPVSGALVFESAVVTLPVPDLTQCRRGHDLAYGEGRLWVGTENFEDDFIYGVRVK
jgi:hypothetical protein